MNKKLYASLWFVANAEEAANFYCSIFDNSKIISTSPIVTNFELSGFRFMGINAGPHHTPNPSISFYVACTTEGEVDSLWNSLIEGGSAMMPLDKYPWSEKYGWLKDKYGYTWQITLDLNLSQKITPSMLFTENSHGRGNEAIDFYTSIFKNSSINVKVPYSAGENPYATEGMIMFSNFTLDGNSFIIMDAGAPQNYSFNDAVSFVVECDTQEEIDYFWAHLTEEGGEVQCGWLRDKFGVSWQIVPTILQQLMDTPAKAQAVTQAFMKMKKLNIEQLKQAAMANKTILTVQATINAPVEKVWEKWTTPEDIMQWNNASDDWHTPKASNDLRVGGTFTSTMAAKDGSMSFDFTGVYSEVEHLQKIAYAMPDGREVKVTFTTDGDTTHVVEDFDPENMHPHEFQVAGWQAILNNFKKYVESH